MLKNHKKLNKQERFYVLNGPSTDRKKENELRSWNEKKNNLQISHWTII